jgi:hypothetical protein
VYWRDQRGPEVSAATAELSLQATQGGPQLSDVAIAHAALAFEFGSPSEVDEIYRELADVGLGSALSRSTRHGDIGSRPCATPTATTSISTPDIVKATALATCTSIRAPGAPEFLDLVSNTNTHAARTRTGAHEAGLNRDSIPGLNPAVQTETQFGRALPARR